MAEVVRWLEGELKDCPYRLVGSGYQGAIRLIELPCGPVIIKEVRSTGPLGALRQATLRREHKAYSKLAGVTGVARCYGLLEDRYLLLEHIAGASLREREHDLTDSSAFYDRLLEIIRHMHHMGVAHGDLKRKDNILVGPAEQPFIVDFGTAHFRRESSGRFRRWLFSFMTQTDYNAWIKRKYRRDYSNLSTEDAALYRPLPLERAVRLVRETWRRLTLRRLRKRLRTRP
jgi:predicted Ser/Thr protein kinase